MDDPAFAGQAAIDLHIKPDEIPVNGTVKILIACVSTKSIEFKNFSGVNR